MPTYAAESFYRAKISSSITSTQSVPITIAVSKLPTVTTWLLTISPNTEFEEIVEYGNINWTNMTIDITKRWIKPSSTLLTTDGVDYNNVAFMRSHTQNDIIRGDVNHIHVNQGIGNTVLATEAWVGISKLSVAASNPSDPIVVGTNDPRVWDASTTQKATVKLSVAPVSASNPIAVGDNDPRLVSNLKVYSEYHAVGASTWTFTVTAWFQPKMVKVTSTAVTSSAISMSYWVKTAAWTQTITTYYQAGTNGNSNTDNINIIYNTFSGSVFNYTCTITATGATFTIAGWSAGNGTALIEMIG